MATAVACGQHKVPFRQPVSALQVTPARSALQPPRHPRRPAAGPLRKAGRRSARPGGRSWPTASPSLSRASTGLASTTGELLCGPFGLLSLAAVHVPLHGTADCLQTHLPCKHRPNTLCAHRNTFLDGLWEGSTQLTQDFATIVYRLQVGCRGTSLLPCRHADIQLAL